MQINNPLLKVNLLDEFILDVVSRDKIYFILHFELYVQLILLVLRLIDLLYGIIFWRLLLPDKSLLVHFVALKKFI